MGNCIDRAESENGSVIEFDIERQKVICYHEENWIVHKCKKLFRRNNIGLVKQIELPKIDDPYADIE